MFPNRARTFLLPTPLIRLLSPSGKFFPQSLQLETSQVPLNCVLLYEGFLMFPMNLFLFYPEHTGDRYLLYISAFLQRVKHFATEMKGSGMEIRHLCSWCFYSRVKDCN